MKQANFYINKGTIMNINNNVGQSRNQAFNDIGNAFKDLKNLLDKNGKKLTSAENKLTAAMDSGNEVDMQKQLLNHQKQQVKFQMIQELMKSKIQMMMKIVQNIAIR